MMTVSELLVMLFDIHSNSLVAKIGGGGGVGRVIYNASLLKMNQSRKLRHFT